MMEPTQGHLTKSLNGGMSSAQKNKETKLKRSRTAVATFKELNSFLCNENSQARCSNRIIQRIRDLKNDIEKGFMHNYLYTEEDLLTLQDIYDFFLRNSDLSDISDLSDLLEFVKEHWYDKVRQEDMDERMRAEEVSASESNHMEEAVEGKRTGENSLESLVDNLFNGDDLKMKDTKTFEAEDGSTTTTSLPKGKNIENKLRNETVKMKIDLGEAVTNENDKNKEEVEKERKRKKKNVEEKLAGRNSEEKGSKPKNARKTQEEVKRGVHWECSECTRGYIRPNLCQDHIRKVHPKGSAQGKKMNGQAENIDEGRMNNIISYPNPQQREDESYRDPSSSSGLRSQSVEETQTSGHQDELMENNLYVVDENGRPCDVQLVTFEYDDLFNIGAFGELADKK